MATLTDSVCLYLAAMWHAATSTTLTGVQVVDGPQANSDPSPDWLFVGFDGLEDSNGSGADVQQSLMAFAKPKFEDGLVTCAIIAERGEPDTIAARSRAYAILAAAEDLLRLNMQLGGLVMHAFVSSHQYFPFQTTSGAAVRIVFTVTYKGQI
jgi:hypothetical protein